jgi:hypothetical protein
MRIVLYIVASTLLAGCAITGTQAQADCEKSYSAIGDIVSCTKSTLAQKNPAKLEDPQAKLYLLRGEQLSADVAAGRMSNVDARVAWQKLYIELWAQEPSPEEKAARMRLLGQMLSQQAQQNTESGYKIVKPPTTTVCTSSPFLGNVRTECTSK